MQTDQQVQRHDDLHLAADQTHTHVGGHSWVAGALQARGGVARREQPSSAQARWRRGSWAKFFHGLWPLVLRRPRVLLLPALAALLLAAAGISGVLVAARNEAANDVGAARGFAENAALNLVNELAAFGTAPLAVLAAFVEQNPGYDSLGGWFPGVTERLMQREGAALASLQLALQGVITLVHPLKGNEAAVGLDLLASPRERASALEAISRRTMTMAGPRRLVQGFEGLIFRMPIFIPGASKNETFGAPRPALNCTVCRPAPSAPALPGGAPEDCADACFRPRAAAGLTGSKFWGFATVVVKADDLRNGAYSRLRRMAELGYDYVLYAPQPGGATTVVERTPAMPSDPLEVLVPLPGGLNPDLSWRLLVAPTKGWSPSWRDPMIAVVVVVSLLVGLLMFVVMVNRRRLIWVVDQLQATNHALAKEKERMDVLLARQYNLICCAMGQNNKNNKDAEDGANAANRGNDDDDAGIGGAGGLCGAGAGARWAQQAQRLAGLQPSRSRRMPLGAHFADLAGSLPHEEALERIESIRRKIRSPFLGVSGGGSYQDDVELMELLGEGSFGKVYRGMWRGSEVAVKVMILPARMSGVEKRERMAIMEAAISSSMHHPNILQTYTYIIKPLDSSYSTRHIDSRGGARGPGEEDSADHSSGRSFTPSCSEVMLLNPSHNTHNFEVSLILEFCDLGTLRDALNSGAFNTEDGVLNYAAVLDTAADVARAMLHLHKQQILHSDLKARNVLFTSDRRDGRGAVAKVADFGLAVRIDPLETHVSECHGTLTHLAPETQLHKRMTKASDVYSFGITLWELYTAKRAYKGIPVALLGHSVAVDGLRPEFPQSAPHDYRQLADACWSHDPEKRPTFDQVLTTLARMREQLGGRTPLLRHCLMDPAKHQLQQQSQQQQQQKQEQQQQQQLLQQTKEQQQAQQGQQLQHPPPLTKVPPRLQLQQAARQSPPQRKQPQPLPPPPLPLPLHQQQYRHHQQQLQQPEPADVAKVGARTATPRASLPFYQAPPPAMPGASAAAADTTPHARAAAPAAGAPAPPQGSSAGAYGSLRILPMVPTPHRWTSLPLPGAPRCGERAAPAPACVGGRAASVPVPACGGALSDRGRSASGSLEVVVCQWPWDSENDGGSGGLGGGG